MHGRTVGHIHGSGAGFKLEHAENTVVAYWMRYCADALSINVTKIHNGGEKTAYYWSKVAKHLEQMQAPPPVLIRKVMPMPQSILGLSPDAPRLLTLIVNRLQAETRCVL